MDSKIKDFYELLEFIGEYESVVTGSSVVPSVMSFLKDRMREMFPDVLSNHCL